MIQTFVSRQWRYLVQPTWLMIVMLDSTWKKACLQDCQFPGNTGWKMLTSGLIIRFILCHWSKFLTRTVTVLKPKPKTVVLRWNRTTTELQFSGGHEMVFLEFQKWPSPVTNVPKQQPNYRLSWTSSLPPAPFEVTDWPLGAELPHSLITCRDWQVDLCAAVGAVRTDVVHTGGLPAMQTNMWMEGGESRLINYVLLKMDVPLHSWKPASTWFSSLMHFFDPNSVYWVAHLPPM